MHGSDDVEGHEFLDLFLFPVVTPLSLLSGRTAGAAEVAKERPQPGDNAHRVILRGRRVIKITWSGEGSRGVFSIGTARQKAGRFFPLRVIIDTYKSSSSSIFPG